MTRKLIAKLTTRARMSHSRAARSVLLSGGLSETTSNVKAIAKTPSLKNVSRSSAPVAAAVANCSSPRAGRRRCVARVRMLPTLTHRRPGAHALPRHSVPIQAVLFDLYETLVTYFDPAWTPPPRTIAERLGVPE